MRTELKYWLMKRRALSFCTNSIIWITLNIHEYRMNEDISNINERWVKFTNDKKFDLYGSQRKVWKIIKRERMDINEYTYTYRHFRGPCTFLNYMVKQKKNLYRQQWKNIMFQMKFQMSSVLKKCLLELFNCI